MDKNKPNEYEKFPEKSFDKLEDFLRELDGLAGDELSRLPFAGEEQGGNPSGSAESSDFAVEKFHGPAGGVVEFLRPDGSGPVFCEYVEVASKEVRAMLAAEHPSSDDLRKMHALVARPGNLLARVRTSGHRPAAAGAASPTADSIETSPSVPLLPGAHVQVTENGEYRAERYGYICLQNNRLSIISPLTNDANWLRVRWLVSAGHPQAMGRQLLEFWLSDLGVQVEMDEQRFADLLQAVNTGTLVPGLYPLVSGTSPVNGKDGQIVLHFASAQQVGRERPDGSIDYHEVNSVINVKENELLARRTEPTTGIVGRDVRGRVLAAADGQAVSLVAGANVRMEKNGHEELFYATTGGVGHHSGGRLSVAKLLVLENGVNYATGNIDFAGDIYVKGVLAPGFSIKAAGDITIAGTVEPGNEIIAGGNVTIGLGIAGKRTTVRAAGSVRAQFIQEATVIAGGDVLLGNYALHARIRSGARVTIQRGSGERGGLVGGGQTWAREGIDTVTAGTPFWNPTELMVGLTPVQAGLLDSLEENIEKSNAHIRQLLDHFGMIEVDLDKIRRLIEAASDVRRKSLAIRAKYLAQVGKALQKMLIARTQFLAQIGPVPVSAKIRIQETAFPGVLIQIGNRKRKLTDEMRAVCFQLEDGELVLK